MMASVTEVSRTVKQPYGGFIKPSQFTTVKFDNVGELAQTENLAPATVGMVVDYMTRYMMGAKRTKAFEISCMGAIFAEKLGYKNAVADAKKLLKKIEGLDDESIAAACKMVWFDAYYRVPIWAKQHQNDEKNSADAQTISNIRIMVERSLSFWEKYGPIVKDGFTFEPATELKEEELKEAIKSGYYGGYTPTVSRGDGDYLSRDTLWDFKVSKRKLSSKVTLQVLIYWIMGLHSGQTEFKNIKNLGVFNPRLNIVYTLAVSEIPSEVIKTVENDVIGYEKAPLLQLTEEKEQVSRRNSIKYKKGDIVQHGVFGRGQVEKVLDTSDDQILTVRYDKVGVKKTMANFAPLTKITEE